ncbi:kinesin-like protein KIF19 isoform X3 [Patella vulgata]|uniref:kinesin-like protein KIF19 isoform X3 n=1 Tax=Patella vulgata TaxID=6465 RepID=UPI0021808ABC|nr:kinesin-like protein KIF19 isoform X3 [Patella vulgata]
MSTKGGGEQTLTVALRIRPLNEDEILQGASPIAYKVENNMVVLLDPTEDHDDILRANRSREKQFVFDCTFDGSANQEDVYEATTKELIPNVITGYNATVFAYGATGAGKTHTMVGKDDSPGIMVRALNDLFLEMEKTSEDMAYKVTMSYLEIYNEMIRDLLNPAAGILDLRENSKGDVTVAGLSEVSARSTDEVMQMLLKGNRERTQEPTAANQASSRSHAVLQVTVRQRHRVKNTLQEVRTGKLFLIDLAGSERAANTHNRGKRMVEGAHINRSLLALGNCINALSEKNGPRYINYRDSKLTRLLKDALGGNCKTVMIAHISPASLNFEESRNTLVYADRAKHIKTKVRRNVTDVAYHIAQYTNIITELREEILRLRDRLHEQGTASRQHAVANIQAVQSEVLMAKDTANRSEMNKLREQLLTCFKDQMELRRSLMEVNNNTMEVSLETNRNQLIISEWDVEKARIQQKRENTQATDNKFDEVDDDVTEPEDVRVAREELKVLHDEKHKTEKVRVTIKRELETAKEKHKKLEELIPVKVSNIDQQEIIRQMCKVHELEIENLQNIAASLMRDFEIKKKDMVITRFRHHRNLCDEIIKQQRDLIDDNNVPCPKDLDELYELYKLERQDKILKGDESNSQTPSLKFLTASGARSTFGDGRQPSSLTDLNSYDDDTKVFTRSAKLKQIEAQWKTNSYMISDKQVIPSIKSRQSFDDKETIVSNTRNIAALAAKKRTRVQNTLLQTDKMDKPRTLYRPTNDSASDFAPNALTPSRLAKHNKDYGEGTFHFNSTPPSDDNISSVTAVEKISIHTDTSLPPLNEQQYKGGVRKISQTETEARRRRRSQQGYEGTISNQNMKKTSSKSVGKPRVSRTKLGDISASGNITQIDEGIPEVKPRREKPRRKYRSEFWNWRK